MTRHKDADWNLNNPAKSWDEAQISVLMDIRDELKEQNRRLNRIENFLGCYRIQDMFKAISRIDKRLAKKFPLRGQ